MKTILVAIQFALAISQTSFNNGQVTYTLDRTQVGQNSNTLTLAFNLNFTLPSQIYLDITLPPQFQQQQNILCGVLGSSLTSCIQMNGLFIINYSSPQTIFKVVFMNFQNPISNISDPIRILCSGSQRNQSLFQTNIQLQFTLAPIEAPQFTLQTPKTLTTQNLTISFNISTLIPVGGYYQLIFPSLFSSTYLISSQSQCSQSCLISDGRLRIYWGFAIGSNQITITNFTTPVWSATNYSIAVSVHDSNDNFISANSTKLLVPLPLDNVSINVESDNPRVRSTTKLTFTITQQIFIQDSLLVIQTTGAIGYQQANLLVYLLNFDQIQPYLLNYQIVGYQIFIPLLPQYYRNNTLRLQLWNVQNQNSTGFVELIGFSIINAQQQISQMGIARYSVLPDFIQGIQLNMSSYLVNDRSNYLLVIQPKFIEINRTVVIQLPSSAQLVGATMQLIPNDLLYYSEINGQKITIRNIIRNNNSSIQIQIFNVLNPSSVSPIGLFNISILVDQNILENALYYPMITLQPQSFQIVNLNTILGLPQQYQDLSFIVQQQFSYDAQNTLSFNIPQDISIDSQRFACSIQQEQFSRNCTKTSSTSIQFINLVNMSSTEMYKLFLYNVQLPRSLAPTSSLNGTLYSNGDVVAVLLGMYVQLSRSLPFTFTVQTSVYVLGETSIWELRFNASNFSLTATDVITLETPEKLQIAGAQCALVLPQETQIQCIPNTALNKITLPLNQNIINGTEVRIKLMQMTNPQFQATGTQFSLRVVDARGYGIATSQYMSQLWVMRNVISAHIGISDIRLGFTFDVEIQFTNVHQIPLGGTIRIDFDEAYFNLLDRASCSFNQNPVACTFGQQSLSLTSNSVRDSSMQRIIITGRTMSSPTTSGIINLGLTVSVDDPLGRMLESGHFISEASIICADACNTCSGSWDSCTSCAIQNFKLQENKCLAECSSGYVFSDQNECELCQNQCLRCSPSNLSICLGCQSGYNLINGLCQQINIVVQNNTNGPTTINNNTNQANMNNTTNNQTNINNQSNNNSSSLNNNITVNSSDNTNKSNTTTEISNTSGSDNLNSSTQINFTSNNSSLNANTTNTSSDTQNLNDSTQIDSNLAPNNINDISLNMTDLHSKANIPQLQPSFRRATKNQLIDIYPVLSGIVLIVILISFIRRLQHRNTRFLTLLYSQLVLVGHVLELVIVIKLFLSDNTIFAIGALSLVVIHLIEQIFSITQISLTLSVDPTYQIFLQQYRSIKAVHLMSSFFSFRFMMLMVSRVGHGPQWDGQWVNRVAIIKQLIGLLKISCCYNSICMSLLGTILFHKDQEHSLIYYEAFTFSGLMLLLDIQQIIFMRGQEAKTYRIQTTDKTTDLLDNIIDITDQQK